MHSRRQFLTGRSEANSSVIQYPNPSRLPSFLSYIHRRSVWQFAIHRLSSSRLRWVPKRTMTPWSAGASVIAILRYSTGSCRRIFGDPYLRWLRMLCAISIYLARH